MLLGSTTTLTATVKFDGNTINTGTVTVGWESTPTNVVQVSPVTGTSVVATATGVGTAQIVVTATYTWDSQTATAQTSFTIRVEEQLLTLISKVLQK